MSDKRTHHPGGILIIDDFLDMRRELVRIIHGSGFHQILEAANAKAALPLIKKMYKENKLSAIVADFRMPGMSGFDLFKALQLDAELKRLPVILLGDHRDLKDLKHLVHKGIYDYILKPLDPKAIEHKMKHLMKSLVERVAA